MRCGLFGKLPAKRDFVAIAAPRAFLRLWEPWLEKGLTAGRASKAEGDFAEAFSTAPIWRFWLGPALCGQAIAGAFMPSVDALGRMFPLTLIASGDDLAPPDVDPREAWFAQVEDVLLDALDPATPFETTVARLEALGEKENSADAQAQDSSARAFAAMRAAQPDCPAQAATFWWTVGGAGIAGCIIASGAQSAPPTVHQNVAACAGQSG